MAAWTPRVIVVGLDGASWSFLEPWIREGELPVIGSLVESGLWGDLESTLPPVTFPAWHSLFTGLNPGRFGVFEFAQLDRGARSIRINSPRDMRGEAVWNLAGRYGLRSVVINVPTARVEEVNGAIVGGPFTPVRRLVYPPGYKLLLRVVGYENYPVELTKVFLQHSRDPRGVLEVVKRTIDSRFKLARLLAGKVKPHLLTLVLFLTDSIQHFYWGSELVLDMWRYIDSRLGELIEEWSGSTLILCSDHGFAGVDRAFNLPKLLEELGLLKLKRGVSSLKLKLLRTGGLVRAARMLHLDRPVLRLLGAERLNRVLSAFSGGGRVGVKGLESLVDWEESSCISIRNTIYVLDRRAVDLSELKGELLGLRDDRGERVVEAVYEKSEVYRGPYLEDAPDLVVLPREGFTVQDNPLASEVVGGLGEGSWKADHTIRGLLLIKGEGVEGRGGLRVSIYSVAPTVMELLGIPVPENLDGEPLATRSLSHAH